MNYSYCKFQDICFNLCHLKESKHFLKKCDRYAQITCKKFSEREYEEPEEYPPYHQGRYGNNKKIITFDYTNWPLTIHIFKGFLCIPAALMEDRILTVKNVKSKKQRHKILVAYHKAKEINYMSDVQLKHLQKMHIIIDAKLIISDDGSKPMTNGDFNEYSILTMYGYKVGRKGLPENERHKLIEYVIDRGYISGYELIRSLQNNIALRELQTKDFSSSIEDWEDDILYIEKYMSKIVGRKV